MDVDKMFINTIWAEFVKFIKKIFTYKWQQNIIPVPIFYRFTCKYLYISKGIPEILFKNQYLYLQVQTQVTCTCIHRSECNVLKTQLVKIIWDQLTDVIIMCKILLNTVFCGFVGQVWQPEVTVAFLPSLCPI